MQAPGKQNIRFSKLNAYGSRLRKRTHVHARSNFLVERKPRSYDKPEWWLIDIARRLELGLFKAAESKEEYMNLNTLKSRMIDVVNKSGSSDP